MVNDFCLKVMEVTTATLDLKDFKYGLLMGFMERIFPKYNFETYWANKLKAERKKIMDAGEGPI
jgi:hypothetical protein